MAKILQGLVAYCLQGVYDYNMPKMTKAEAEASEFRREFEPEIEGATDTAAIAQGWQQLDDDRNILFDAIDSYEGWPSVRKSHRAMAARTGYLQTLGTVGTAIFEDAISSPEMKATMCTTLLIAEHTFWVQNLGAYCSGVGLPLAELTRDHVYIEIGDGIAMRAVDPTKYYDARAYNEPLNTIAGNLHRSLEAVDRHHRVLSKCLSIFSGFHANRF